MTLLWGNNWHKRWQDPPLAPTSTTKAASSLWGKTRMLLPLLSHAQIRDWGPDETSSSLKGLCFISEDFDMTGESTLGKIQARLGGNEYSGNKDCDNCAPLQLERHYAASDSTRRFWKYNLRVDGKNWTELNWRVTMIQSDPEFYN